jgi:hypothetical protein
VIDKVPQAQKNLTGMNDSYSNFTEIHGRCHASNNSKQGRQHRKEMKKIIHHSDDAATVSVEIHT